MSPAAPKSLRHGRWHLPVPGGHRIPAVWVTEHALVLAQEEAPSCPLEGCPGRWSLRGCPPFSASRPDPSSNGLSAFEPFPLDLPAPRESRAHQDHETQTTATQRYVSFHVLNIWLSQTAYSSFPPWTKLSILWSLPPCPASSLCAETNLCGGC